MSKFVCQLNEDGIFLGMTPCQPSPLEPGVYLIPGRAIDVEQAPEIPEGKMAKWVDGAWEMIDIPVEEESSEEEPSEEEPVPMVAAVKPAAKAKKGKK